MKRYLAAGFLFFLLSSQVYAGPLDDYNGNGLWDFYDEILVSAIPERARPTAEKLARHIQAFTLVSGSQSLALQEVSGAQSATLCLLAAYGPDTGGKFVTALTRSVLLYPEMAGRFMENEAMVAGQQVPYVEDPALWLETYCPAELNSPPVPQKGSF